MKQPWYMSRGVDRAGAWIIGAVFIGLFVVVIAALLLSVPLSALGWLDWSTPRNLWLPILLGLALVVLAGLASDRLRRPPRVRAAPPPSPTTPLGTMTRRPAAPEGRAEP